MGNEILRYRTAVSGESRISMAARMLQRFKPTLPEKWKGGKIEKIGRCMLLIQQ